tara:strand:+ start:26 stop:598 length:573 start_codon:yes stop_codon:yes gene_type:complete
MDGKIMKLIFENWRQFTESHTKEQEEELKTIVGELEKASEMHAGQAKRIQQILDETDDDNLEEGDNFFDNMRAKQKRCKGKPKTGDCAEDRPTKKAWKKITKEQEELEEEEKPCKPSKGKRFAKRVDGKCRSYGQAGQAKGGGDRIQPGTAKGDAYCARSAKIKKCKNPPCANDLSRKKWKCRGSKSMKE